MSINILTKKINGNAADPWATVMKNNIEYHIQRTIHFNANWCVYIYLPWGVHKKIPFLKSVSHHNSIEKVKSGQMKPLKIKQLACIWKETRYAYVKHLALEKKPSHLRMWLIVLSHGLICCNKQQFNGTYKIELWLWR